MAGRVVIASAGTSSAPIQLEFHYGDAVAALDFNVAIVVAKPPVDVIGHLDHPAVEAKSSELFGAAFVYVGFDLDLHGLLSQSGGRFPTGAPGFLGLKTQKPAPPIRRTGVSSGVFG